MDLQDFTACIKTVFVWHTQIHKDQLVLRNTLRILTCSTEVYSELFNCNISIVCFLYLNLNIVFFHSQIVFIKWQLILDYSQNVCIDPYLFEKLLQDYQIEITIVNDKHIELTLANINIVRINWVVVIILKIKFHTIIHELFKAY